MLDTSTKNTNFLLPNRVKLMMKRAPVLEYNVQKINIPSLTLPPVPFDNPFVKIPEPGEHLEYDTLRLEFLVSEEMDDYLEIYSWIIGLGKPKSFGQFKAIQDKSQEPMNENGEKSDIKVVVLDSKQNPKFAFVYRDAFPIHLEIDDLDTTVTMPEPLSARAIFAYTYFDIERI